MTIAKWLGVDDKSPEVTWLVAQEKCKTYGARIFIQPRTFSFSVHPTGIQIHTPALITPGLTVTLAP